MNGSLVVLYLVLDALGKEVDIKTFNNRKAIQKSVYLAQRLKLEGGGKLDLGYRFGWYRNGPYSPALADDYYSLAENIRLGEDDYENRVLKKPFSDRFIEARENFNQPDDNIQEGDWLELLASIDYLITVGGRSKDNLEQIKEDLRENNKERLLSHFSSAIDALKDLGLWDS